MAIANQSAAADHVTSLASADWSILGQMLNNVLTCGLSLSTSLDDHGFLSNNVLEPAATCRSRKQRYLTALWRNRRDLY